MTITSITSKALLHSLTGVNAGDKYRITADNREVEFAGAYADSVAGLTLAGTGVSALEGAWMLTGTSLYHRDGQGDFGDTAVAYSIRRSSARWNIYDATGQLVEQSKSGGDYPWEAQWRNGLSVTQNDSASDFNWIGSQLVVAAASDRLALPWLRAGQEISDGTDEFYYDGGTISEASSWIGSADIAGLTAALAASNVAASETVAGKIELATQIESNQRRDTARAVTPKTLRDVNAEPLSGNKTLVAGDAPLQLLEPNGANRDVTLPVIAATPTGDQVGYGHPIEIRHAGVADSLILKNSAGAQLARIDIEEYCYVIAGSTGWTVLKSPRNGVMILTYPNIEITSGTAGDDVTIYTPVAGLRGDIIGARWISDTVSGTISVQGQVTLQAGATAISSALALGTTPTVDHLRDFALSSPRPCFSSANPIILDKTALATGTTPVHRGTLILALALI